MNTWKIFLFVLGVQFMYSCDTDYELKRSFFKEDPTRPGLPVYSEKGYNTFGAYYDAAPFVSHRNFVSAKWIDEANHESLLLEGYLNDGVSNYASLQFQFTDISPATHEDLIELHQKQYDLKTDNVLVTVIKEGVPFQMEVLEGELHFKRAQNMLVDRVPQQVILSGTFGIKGIVDGVPVNISDGRFDLGFGTHNYFKL